MKESIIIPTLAVEPIIDCTVLYLAGNYEKLSGTMSGKHYFIQTPALWNETREKRNIVYGRADHAIADLIAENRFYGEAVLDRPKNVLREENGSIELIRNYPLMLMHSIFHPVRVQVEDGRLVVKVSNPEYSWLGHLGTPEGFSKEASRLGVSGNLSEIVDVLFNSKQL